MNGSPPRNAGCSLERQTLVSWEFNTVEYALGIDLGTTYSVVAVQESDGKCRTLRNAEGDLTTPSVVFFDADHPIVGKEAIKAGVFEPDRVAYLAKRDMGKDHFHRLLMGQQLPPEVIQGIVLRKLREDAAMQLGEVSQAVITVPAYFNEPRRKATQDAGRIAGLDVIDIINEPTAAAIAYGVQEGFLDERGIAGQRELILVYDLGGGTFDATLMEIDGSSYRAVATAGDVHLGGVDWDERIINYAAEEFSKQHELDPRKDKEAFEELRREAEEVRRALTARSSATMHVTTQGKRTRIDIDRTRLRELTDDLAERTLFTCRKVLADAKSSWHEVTRVLAVGGSSRMPQIQEALEAESGKKVDRSLSPDEAVAHGAAVYARLISGGAISSNASVSVTNVSSHDLGVLGVEKSTGMPRRKVLIPRNSPLPASGDGRFQTRSQGQRDISVKVVEGGDASGNHATLIGQFVVRDLPEDLKQGEKVFITFQYQENGRLGVSAKVAGREEDAAMAIERAHGLNEEEVAAWQTRVAENTVLAPVAGVQTSDSDPAGDDVQPGGPTSAPDDDPFDQFLDPAEADLLGDDMDDIAGETPLPGPLAAPEPVPDFGASENISASEDSAQTTGPDAADLVDVQAESPGPVDPQEAFDFLLDEDPKADSHDDDALNDFFKGLE